uniref:BZIP domain-containing protein n=1 Tax=Ascaris lumbricoides TaxID=6252 RepID=A0A0M3I0I8_ASCLU
MLYRPRRSTVSLLNLNFSPVVDTQVLDCLHLGMANSVVTSTRRKRKKGRNTKIVTVEAAHSQKIPKPGQDPSTSEAPQRKKRRLHTYERARLAYERIQAERKAEAERRRAGRESREKALQSYLSTKRKMDKALLKRNRKGQPKLNAQIEVLLEKIEKRMKN